MAHDAQTVALDFLTGEHQLTPDEAAQALRVARTVLGEGLARLRRAVADGDIPAVRELAHALKGNLLNLGLADLAAQAQELEKSAQNSAVADQERLADLLTRELAVFGDQ